MKNFVKTFIKRSILVVALAIFTSALFAQESSTQAFEKANANPVEALRYE